MSGVGATAIFPAPKIDVLFLQYGFNLWMLSLLFLHNPIIPQFTLSVRNAMHM